MVVRPTTEDDWQQVRALRLEMLADTPMAYGETLASALTHDETVWRTRARRGTDAAQLAVVAVAPDGRWVGAAGCVVLDGGPMLVGVYVAPSHRGRAAGVTDALLASAEDWARPQGSIRLFVHEDNSRAQTAYRRRGYLETGASVPYDVDPTRREIEMVKKL